MKVGELLDMEMTDLIAWIQDNSELEIVGFEPCELIPTEKQITANN